MQYKKIIATKSAKNLKNSEKLNMINKNISMNKRKYIKNNINKKYKTKLYN